MKIYRLDCSSSYRLVFQFKNRNIIVRIREWYKLMKRVSKLTWWDIDLLHTALEEFEDKLRKEKVNNKFDYFENENSLFSHIESLKNKLR